MLPRGRRLRAFVALLIDDAFQSLVASNCRVPLITAMRRKAPLSHEPHLELTHEQIYVDRRWREQSCTFRCDIPLFGFG